MKFVFLSFLLLISNLVSSQNTYYISAKGNNNNNGTSPATPWKTIKYLEPGKTYLLKKGETFYFNIYDTANPIAANKITISSYDSGSKPIINLYKTIKGTGWIKHAGNIWKVDLKNTNNYTGFVSKDSNIGFIKVNGIIHGNKLANLHALIAQWDYYSDNTYLYIYSTVNPSLNNPLIEASCNVDAISLSDNMAISDIEIKGSGAHAINGDNRKNVTLKNIDIKEIGGSYLPGYGNGTTRYGNGIQFWNGSNNCLIESCNVSKVYDAAFTMQGNGPNTTFINTTFKNNTADRNEQSLEMWVSGNTPGFINCKFIENKCTNAGLGWSHDVRPDKQVGVHILSYAWEVKNSDVLIQGNTFSKAKSGIYYWGYEWDSMPNYVSKNNQIFLDANTPIRSVISTYRIENSQDFVTATGKEAGSAFNTILKDILPVNVENRIKIITVTPNENTGMDYNPWLNDDLNSLVKSNWQAINQKYTEVSLKLERKSIISKLSLYDMEGQFIELPAELYAVNGTKRTLLGKFTGNLYKAWTTLVIDDVAADAILIRKYGNNIPQKIQVYGKPSLETSGNNILDDITYEWRLYPNPTLDKVNVELPAAIKGEIKVELLDTTGQMLQQIIVQKASSNFTQEISLGNLQSGFYFIRLQAIGFFQVKKVAKR